MAETREIFTVLSDGADEGIEYVGKAPGGAQGTDEQAPVLPAVDSSGNLQNLPLVADGATPSGDQAQPVLSYIDSAGNLTYPQLNADGTIPVSFDSGTANSASANVTIAALNTEQDVVSIALGNSEQVSTSMAMGGSFQPCVWVLYHNDNATLNEIARFVTGPGDFQHTANMQNISFTSGAAGAQSLVLRATQLRGKLTDAHGTVSCVVV